MLLSHQLLKSVVNVSREGSSGRKTCGGARQFYLEDEPKTHATRIASCTSTAFGGPQQVLRYLGRYTHRVAISNHRLVASDGDNVTFRGGIMLTATCNAR